VEDKMATTKEVVEKFSKKTIPQLQAYAKKHDIDLYGTNTKEEMLEAILPFVPRHDPEDKPKIENPKERVALFSKGNINWVGVGALEKGITLSQRRHPLSG